MLVRVVDVCFAVARAEDGSFRFGPEEPPWVVRRRPSTSRSRSTSSARLLDEWREIQAVIPSLDCRIRLADELGVDELVVDRERWQLLVAIDGRRSVRELVRKTNRPVLDVCHAILALVDAGAVNVGRAAGRAASRRAPNGNGGKRAAEPAVEPEAPYGPGVESPHPGPNGAVAEDDEREVDPAEKGQYLQGLLGPARRLTLRARAYVERTRPDAGPPCSSRSAAAGFARGA